VASLIVWMNGEKVGEWGSLRGGTSFFRYEKSWVDSRHARALSLSLPLTANLAVQGSQVDYYFDNLLPDSPQIRGRIRTRFNTRSTAAFDLLMAIGRDCVGAVQLLPADEEPIGWNRIDATALKGVEVERILRNVTTSAPLGRGEDDDFRISIAGAQEKTALLSMGGKWFRPHHSTPTTHILKLPLGIIGGFSGDFSDSVENEWLCGRILAGLDLPVAHSRIERFGDQRALVVTRFDRQWAGAGPDDVERESFKPGRHTRILRVPQEDLCQATGRPQTRKYEADGGPSILEILELLANSEQAHIAQAHFVLAQLAFWLLAATDGHGKNFSIFNRAGGTYALTPLYDVLSAWPVIGHGKNQLAIEKARLAMAVRGKRPHYRLNEITARHWRGLAERTGIPGLWQRMEAFVASAEPVVKRLEGRLPRHFPERVYTTIRDGVKKQSDRFARER